MQIFYYIAYIFRCCCSQLFCFRLLPSVIRITSARIHTLLIRYLMATLSAHFAVNSCRGGGGVVVAAASAPP